MTVSVAAVAVHRAGIADLVRNDLCVPLRALYFRVLPLYFVTQSWGIYDTYTGLLLRVAVHLLLVADEGFLRHRCRYEHAAMIVAAADGALSSVSPSHGVRRSHACRAAGWSPGTNSCSR